MTRTAWTYIFLDKQKRPWVRGANTKVTQIVLSKLAYGWSPEEICRQFPHLTLAQVHAALGYYYDHQSELDQQIQHQLRKAREMAAEFSSMPLARKLKKAMATARRKA